MNRTKRYVFSGMVGIAIATVIWSIKKEGQFKRGEWTWPTNTVQTNMPHDRSYRLVNEDAFKLGVLYGHFAWIGSTGTLTYGTLQDSAWSMYREITTNSKGFDYDQPIKR